jgi:predicted dehydrogenase/threonine dehydrogenase-like Zn-dependent dehydrogenase
VLQVIQNARTGRLGVNTVPDPLVRAGHLLIANAYSVISAGTEKMVTDLARKSLLGKVRERPDHVRRILQKMRTEGFFKTLSQVFAKLNEPIGLGYSSAGVVLAAGAGVQGFKPGDRVASNGPHAGVVCIPKNLCALIPEGVPLEQAAFATLGAIALQGVRLARLGLGDTAFVIGLGLIGQITVKLLKAQGCRVLGTDLDPAKCALAMQMGADHAHTSLGAAQAMDRTGALGADAVLITAATKSDGPIELAAGAVRSKGRVVAVGAVGLNLPRHPFYLKEAEFVVSCSYGPGRYDPVYEAGGHDYPPGYVRWTEQRNMQAILDLMAAGRLDVASLITHRFKIAEAEAAYHLIESGTEPYLGIALEYPEVAPERRQPRLTWKTIPASGTVGVGCLGAGGFARMVLLPAILKTPGLYPRVLCSGRGLSAASSGEGMGFDAVTADEDEVFGDPQVQVVFAITQHDQHARQVVQSLKAGKHVFVEKPLALTVEELVAIEQALLDGPDPRPLLMVGFNRRFAPASRTVKEFFVSVDQPLTISIRFNAGAIPAEHWTQKEEVGGGRIIGEACHAIDLATFLTGSPPVRVFAESIGGPHAPPITDDQCFITLRHANGSISNIGYLAGGDKAFPKERVEVLGGGRLAVIEDFSEVITSVNGKTKRARAWSQDKGHRTEIEAFATALTKGGPAPISWEELRGVSLASILAVRSIREGVPFEIPRIGTELQAGAKSSHDLGQAILGQAG